VPRSSTRRPRSSSHGGRGRGASLLVLEKLDGYVAERRGGEITRRMGKASGEEASLAVCQFEFDGRLAQNCVFHIRGAADHVDVVVTVAVHLRGFVWGDFEIKDAYGFVFENEVMMRLGGDFDFWSCLSCQDQGGENDRKEQRAQVHRAEF